MFRKIAFGLIAALSLATLASSPASAHGFHGHWGGHWGGHFFGGPTFVVGGSDCYQQVVVQTRHGPRVRVVNTCGYVY
jgi:hypothetical protein